MAYPDPPIPDGAFESLAAVLELSDRGFAGLLAALDEPREAAESEDLLEAFVAFRRLGAAQGWSSARTAERIARSDAAPVMTDDDAERLRGRVEALLETSAVRRAA